MPLTSKDIFHDGIRNYWRLQIVSNHTKFAAAISMKTEAEL